MRGAKAAWLARLAKVGGLAASLSVVAGEAARLRGDARVFLLSLAFLSVDGLYRAVGHEKRDPIRPQFTDHCFTGDYPTHLTDIIGESAKQQLSLLAEAG